MLVTVSWRVYILFSIFASTLCREPVMIRRCVPALAWRGMRAFHAARTAQRVCDIKNNNRQQLIFYRQ